MTAIEIRDGDETVAEGPWGRDVTLAVTVVLQVSGPDPGTLGTALNAAYAQALRALWVDRTLDGRVGDIAEGAFRPQVATEGAPAMSGALDLEVTYRASGAPGQREAVCAALAAALAENIGAAVSRRETVLAAFLAQLATGLGEVIPRNRERPQRSGLTFFDGPQVPRQGYLGEAAYTAEPRVRIAVTDPDPLQLGPLLNARIAAVRAVALAGDRRLGGLVDDIRDGDGEALETLLVDTPGTAPMMLADLPFALWYATDEQDPTAVAT